MPKALSGLELETLVRIVESKDTFYKYPTKRHDLSNRLVVCIGKTTQHLNVDAVDVLRFEGYLQITNKNHSGTATVVPTNLGRDLVISIVEF